MLTLTRSARLLLAFALAVLTILAWTWVRPTPAYAADDQIDPLRHRLHRGASGVLQVQETITWRFGDESDDTASTAGLIVREPYDETQDAGL